MKNTRGGECSNEKGVRKEGKEAGGQEGRRAREGEEEGSFPGEESSASGRSNGLALCNYYSYGVLYGVLVLVAAPQWPLAKTRTGSLVLVYDFMTL